MSTTPPADALPPQPPRRRRRVLLGCSGFVLLLLAGLVGLWFFVKWQADRELRDIIAQIDQKEPGGWRLPEIEAARTQPPDDQNAALVCMRVKQRLPSPWPVTVQPAAGPQPPGDGPAANAPAAAAGTDPSTPDMQLGDLPQPMQLDPDLLRQLRVNLDRAAPARDEARKLLSLSEGRYPLSWPPGNPLNVVLNSQDARAAAHLLRIQAAVQAQDGQPDDALDSVRGILVAARSIGDEPIMISMLIRVACQAVAINALERVLAQGEPSSAALEAVQRLLELEQHEPLILNAARGERAMQHELMESMKSGQLSLSRATGTRSLSPLDRLADLSTATLARRSHPRLLRLMTEFVELARQPSAEQADGLKALDQQSKMAQGQGDVLVGLLMPAIAKCGEAARRGQGNLRSAIAAVAVERYRRDHGRWPDRLDDLVPRYLEAVPEDPSIHQPLRFKKLPDGVLVYWTGLDGQDDGGQVGPRVIDPNGKDMGFRLWDPAHRRQPPREMLPMPEEVVQP